MDNKGGGYELKERLNKEWSVKGRKTIRIKRERKYRCRKNKKKEGKGSKMIKRRKEIRIESEIKIIVQASLSEKQ